jgi:hypothetical protein
MEPIPLGQAEGQNLEFKGEDALRDLSSISRAVVAMLNADGGTIWIGVDEENGRAVRATPIRAVEEQRDRLRDHLVDSLEPSPSTDEISLVTVAAPGGHVLRIDVRPAADKKPYARWRGSARDFIRRDDRRIVTIDRADLARAFSRSPAPTEPIAEQRRRLAELRAAGPADAMWICLLPIDDLALDLGPNRTFLDSCFVDATVTGNRPNGWNFTDWGYPEHDGDRVCSREGSRRRTCIHASGRIEFTMPLQFLHWKGEQNDIYPWILCEIPVSLMRLARTVFARLAARQETKLLADMALHGARGWQLRPYAHVYAGYHGTRGPKIFKGAKDLVLPEALLFEQQELDREPDWCAFRLLTRVYAAFGWSEEFMPPDFDRKSRRLILPA